MTPSGDDHALAAQLAEQAGQVLLARRAAAVGLTGAELRALGDGAAQEFLAAELARIVPGDSVLSEEAADDEARLGAERVWIIDPLDGTREYAEGRDDFAVHVALWERGELSAGAVSLPARGLTYRTDRPGDDPGRPAGRAFTLAVSRSRAPELVTRLREVLDAEVSEMGSAGVKAMAVVSGEVDAYVHAGGQYEWDSAAPVAVARAHGLHVSRIDGAPLVYNRPNPYLPDLLVCREHESERLLGAIARVTRDPNTSKERA